jgi:diadenosine tetraphosphate (Ap4A) HIT family hydrolase
MAIISSVDCIDDGTDWKISIPTQGLASKSLYIERKGDKNPSELFRMMNKVATYWEQKKGIFNYLVYTSSEDQGWEMLPVPGEKSSWRDWMGGIAHQFTVMGRVTFGRYTLAESEKKHLYTEYNDLTSFQTQVTGDAVQQVSPDAFCKKEVIDSQLLWEGEHVRVLYNYAPIGNEGLHFLLVPKAHKERLSQLTQEEFEEIQALAGMLKQHYPDHTCYRYNKSGSLAGQTVLHFHEHVVFILPQHDLKGKLSVFFRMIGSSKPLNLMELAKRVSLLKAQFIAPE